MNIPGIARLDDRPVLMVNDEPILLFGGEIHNSSACRFVKHIGQRTLREITSQGAS